MNYLIVYAHPNPKSFCHAIKTTIDAGIFKFCGMKVALHKYFYAVPAITDAARKKMLAEIGKINF